MNMKIFNLLAKFFQIIGHTHLKKPIFHSKKFFTINLLNIKSYTRITIHNSKIESHT